MKRVIYILVLMICVISLTYCKTNTVDIKDKGYDIK